MYNIYLHEKRLKQQIAQLGSQKGNGSRMTNSIDSKDHADAEASIIGGADVSRIKHNTSAMTSTMSATVGAISSCMRTTQQCEKDATVVKRFYTEVEQEKEKHVTPKNFFK